MNMSKNFIKSFGVFDLASIITILKFINVLIYMFFGYMMINSVNSAFHQSPKAFDVISVRYASCVFFLAMYYNIMSFKFI